MPFFEDYDERSISFNFKAKLIERQYIITTTFEDITDFKSRQPRKGQFLNFYAAKIKENS